MNIILASASPRRSELLKKIYANFSIVPSLIEETVPNEIRTESSAEYLAVKKAVSVLSKESDSLVIACDTIVLINDIILGKPKDENDARRMMEMLRGNRHKVITGCCLSSYLVSEERPVTLSFSEVTEVEFYPLTDNEIEQYLSEGEFSDKAGGYGIQGKGALLVKGIIGDYYNVMGLPISRLKREIEQFMKNCLKIT